MMYQPYFDSAVTVWYIVYIGIILVYLFQCYIAYLSDECPECCRRVSQNNVDYYKVLKRRVREVCLSKAFSHSLALIYLHSLVIIILCLFDFTMNKTALKNVYIV